MFRSTLISLLPLYTLVAANPIASAPSGLDVNNPSGSDPTTPPKSISFPSAAANPFPSGFPTQPSSCDGENPSEDCFKAMGASGGYLYFASDSMCSASQQSTMQTAVWDATTLAMYSSNFPNYGFGTRGQASGIFYMGSDFASQQSRIAGNLKRAWEFKTSRTRGSAYITMSCKDTKGYCTRTIEGKAVGGYAWTYSGWFDYYHYITFCPTFFTLDTMDEKINQVTQELAGGDTRSAKDMVYLRTTGQFFLHELMHTRIASGDDEPEIIDEYLAPIPDGEKAGTNDLRAYGPRLVHALAKRSISDGGGVTRASTNADSYAMLANAAWWWDTTGYFPGVPGKQNPSSASDDFDDDDFPVSLYIELGNTTDPSTADFTSLFDDNILGFGNGPPDPDDQVIASPTIPTSSIIVGATPSPNNSTISGPKYPNITLPHDY